MIRSWKRSGIVENCMCHVEVASNIDWFVCQWRWCCLLTKADGIIRSQAQTWSFTLFLSRTFIGYSTGNRRGKRSHFWGVLRIWACIFGFFSPWTTYANLQIHTQHRSLLLTGYWLNSLFPTGSKWGHVFSNPAAITDIVWILTRDNFQEEGDILIQCDEVCRWIEGKKCDWVCVKKLLWAGKIQKIGKNYEILISNMGILDMPFNWWFIPRIAWKIKGKMTDFGKKIPFLYYF